MKFKLVALMLTAFLSGCGGSASSEVENSALPDLRYQLALELYLRDSVVTGNTILSYGGGAPASAEQYQTGAERHR